MAFQSFSFCVLSFHNRLDLIREPAIYWVLYFIFPIYPCLFHHICKNEKVLSVLVCGLPGLGFGVGLVTGSCHSQFFLLACPSVSQVISFIYDVRVRKVVSMFNETSHSFFVWGSS